MEQKQHGMQQQQEYQGPERRKSQAQYPGEERRRLDWPFKPLTSAERDAANRRSTTPGRKDEE